MAIPARRLEAEAIRDCILSATDKLDLQIGGAGFSAFESNLRMCALLSEKGFWTGRLATDDLHDKGSDGEGCCFLVFSIVQMERR